MQKSCSLSSAAVSGSQAQEAGFSCNCCCNCCCPDCCCAHCCWYHCQCCAAHGQDTEWGSLFDETGFQSQGSSDSLSTISSSNDSSSNESSGDSSTLTFWKKVPECWQHAQSQQASAPSVVDLLVIHFMIQRVPMHRTGCSAVNHASDTNR